MIDTALKEWASVTRLLTAGRYALLLRKGGIAEDDGPGRFRLEVERFALFPAWEHERSEWLKPEARDAAGPAPAGQAPSQAPSHIDLGGHAEVGRIWRVPSRAAFDRLDPLHPWLAPQIDMRFNYKPDRPLYLLALRCHRWPRPHRIAYTDTHAGCRSWVPLEGEERVPEALLRNAQPAMPDADYAATLASVDAVFG